MQPALPAEYGLNTFTLMQFDDANGGWRWKSIAL